MKKKILTKQILLAIAMAGLVPMGQAWAEEIPDAWQPEIVDGNKLIIHNATNTVQTNYTYQGRELGSFDTVEIYYVPSGSNRPLGVYSARYDLQKTNIIVHYDENSGSENNDALHLSNHYPHFNIRSFYADVTANSSDGINLSHDITSDDGSLEASVVIGNDEEPVGVNGNGNLTLTIKDGSGIRANASCISADVTNSIAVKGTTDITINGDSDQFGVVSPTAVYAGADSYFDEAVKEGEKTFVGIDLGFIKYGIDVINTSSKGQGIINLEGQTYLQLNGTGNYGLWAGKNGEITAANLQIIAGENNTQSFGVAATNGNITWGNHILGKDDSLNTHGSKITLNGEINVIQMNSDNSCAIYAEGVDINGVSNTVKSGENGIGYLWAKGNIEAEDSGAIVLSMNNAMPDEANPDEKVSFYLNGAAMASNGGQTVLKSAYDNWITSSNVVYTSGSVLNRKNVVSALYADNGTVKISGASNVISSSYENMGDGNGERTVWAQNGGTVNIFGQTAITASNADNGDGNSKGIAVVAGTENWGSGEPNYDMADEKRSHVNITYNGASAVTGDLVAGYGGAVNISMNPVSSLDNGEGQTSHSLSLTGNALAGNGGILNVELGNGGVFTGRADDYQEADEKKASHFIIRSSAIRSMRQDK